MRRLLDDASHGFSMTAGTRTIETSDGSEYEGENGLVYGHAYTLLDVTEV